MCLPELSRKELAAFVKKNAKAKSIIVASITDKYIEYVKKAQTAYEMLKCLEQIFEGKSDLLKVLIRRKLLQLKFE